MLVLKEFKGIFTVDKAFYETFKQCVSTDLPFTHAIHPLLPFNFLKYFGELKLIKLGAVTRNEFMRPNLSSVVV